MRPIVARFFGWFLVGVIGVSIVHARTYYISPDGSDSNPGTSVDEPWKSLIRSSNADLATGDSVLLRRGGVWHETYAVSTDGLSLGAYGKGDRPIIDGGELVEPSSIQTTEMPGIVRVPADHAIDCVWSGTGAALAAAKSRAELNGTADSFFRDGNWLYIHSRGVGEAFEIPNFDMCVEIKHSRVTLDSIAVCHAGRTDRGAITVWADQDLNGISIQNCQIADNRGRGVWLCGPPTASIRDVEILNNQFLRNDGSGLLMVLADDSEVRGNKFSENCRVAIEPWQAGIRIWSGGIRNLVIANNVIRDQRWFHDNDSSMGIHCDETGPVTIVDNTIQHVDHAGIEIENTRGITADRNVIKDANIGIFINRAGHDHIVRANTITDSRSMAIFLHAWRAHGVDAGPEIEVDGELLTRNRVEQNHCSGSHLAELKAIDGAEITAGPLGNIYRGNDFGPERAGFIEWGERSFDSYKDWAGAATRP